MSDSDDDQPQLSSSTVAALEEFLREKQEREDLLKRICEEDQTSDILVDEDWVCVTAIDMLYVAEFKVLLGGT